MVPYQLSEPTTCQPIRLALVGDLAGQAGDAGVVVDLDADLAAVDGGLGLGGVFGSGSAAASGWRTPSAAGRPW